MTDPITAKLNEIECDWNDGFGIYTTPPMLFAALRGVLADCEWFDREDTYGSTLRPAAERLRDTLAAALEVEL